MLNLKEEIDDIDRVNDFYLIRRLFSLINNEEIEDSYKLKLEVIKNDLEDSKDKIDCIFVKNRIKVILRDQLFKKECNKNSKEELEILKLLNAREESSDFELDLAQMICGDNEKFPYLTSFYITEFFKNLGFHFIHDGSTRKYWISDRLKECSIKDIHLIITKGLFSRIRFRKAEKDFDIAISEFKEFIEDSILSRESINLSSLFSLNIKNELLFNKKTRTKDIEFNNLIDDSKKFFIDGDKQIALEKIWDAFERMKTLIDEDKKKSLNTILSLLSLEIKEDVFNDEFGNLTKIGNNYKIRHHEVGKIPINSDLEKEYLFFRVLSLIDFTVNKLESKQ
ncbi:MAG: hypothetical protein BWY78_00756 [Alphaproteobacteria bacterium ADurb.Bin438]|nr:MAG: hypothetical protein BWY78_00756 [Alphaproteobacteria bacterium ADurb.Bin438]